MSRSSAEQYLASINLKLANLDARNTKNPSEIVSSSFEQEGKPLHTDPAPTLSPNAPPAAPCQTSIKHFADTDAPHIPPKTNNIGRIAMKAAWLIEQETQRPANVKKVMQRLGEWFSTDSDLAEGYIKGFDEKEMIITWFAAQNGEGKDYSLKGCKRHLDLWRESCKAAEGK